MYKNERKYVADLMFKVIAKVFCVREVLLKFPKNCDDPSINCAYHALTHLEADEDIRFADPLYADEQNKYIEMIALTLFEGNPLPQNLIEGYNEYYPEAPPNFSSDKKGILKNLMRFINT